MPHHDLLIIGAGSGNSIIGPEHDDLDVAIAERGAFGGTCLNVGCIPSKMFVYAAEVAALAEHVGPSLGVHTSLNGADWPAIRDRVFGRIDPIAQGGADYRRSLDHVTVYDTSVSFVDAKTVRAGDAQVTADQIVIAAGARPVVPDIAGLSDVGFHTSDTIMRVDELPKRLAVLGGGYIATELGNVFGSFGSEVTFIVRGGSLLRNEDHDVSAVFTAAYAERFDVRLNTQVESVRREGDDIVLTLDSGRPELRVDAILVATGRVPNSDQLGLRDAGYEVSEAGYLQVDEHGRTKVDGVFGLGDITNPVQLKHVANHEARVVRHNLSNPTDLRSFNHRHIPHAVFSHPQVASVGLTQAQAETANLDVVCHVQSYGSAAYGWAMEDDTSIVKLVMDRASRLLLGAHICGPQASTLIQQLVQGMTFDQSVDDMARGQYYAHPALPEVIEQALLEL